MNVLNKQVGGSHYKEMKIQPVEFIRENNIPYCEANIIKYVCRHANKNGKQDLEKAKHYLEMLIAAYDEQGKAAENQPLYPQPTNVAHGGVKLGYCIAKYADNHYVVEAINNPTLWERGWRFLEHEKELAKNLAENLSSKSEDFVVSLAPYGDTVVVAGWRRLTPFDKELLYFVYNTPHSYRVESKPRWFCVEKQLLPYAVPKAKAYRMIDGLNSGKVMVADPDCDFVTKVVAPKKEKPRYVALEITRGVREPYFTLVGLENVPSHLLDQVAKFYVTKDLIRWYRAIRKGRNIATNGTVVVDPATNRSFVAKHTY